MAAFIRLLLIESDPDEADRIGTLLRDPQAPTIDISRSRSLTEALGSIAVAAPDVILLDPQLPDSEGEAAVSALLAASRDVPIVVLGGVSDPKLSRACVAVGAVEAIGKRGLRAPRLRRAIAYAVAQGAETTARRQVAHYRELLSAIVESSTDGIFACNREGRIVSWNAGAEAIFGFSESEAIGAAVEAIIRAPESRQAEQQANLADRSRGIVLAGDVERLRKDGTRAVLSARDFRLPNLEGMEGGVGTVCRDVTDLIDKTDALVRQNDELRTRDRQMRALAARLDAVREEEGKRIAREVHDELGQLLTSLKWDLQWVESRLEDPALIARLRGCGDLADQTIAATQRIATELRPSVLDAFGLAAAIRDEARRFGARMAIRVNVEAADDHVPPEPATALFRIFQEILTNVARHARASHVSVHFSRTALASGGEGWLLDVSDDGAGFIEDPAAPSHSLGLLGMRERAALLGGSVDIETAPARGTRVVARIAIGGEQRVGTGT